MFISEEQAYEAGMTHEGTLYGVSVWMCNDIGFPFDGFFAVPKFVPFGLWIWFCDCVYDAAVWFIPEDKILPTPVKMGREIKCPE